MIKIKNTIIILLIFSCLNTNIAFASEKPLFITVTSEWCTTCKKLKPVIEEIEYLYNNKFDFITLDTSSKASLEKAKEEASEKGITSFFDKYKSDLPTVGIFCANNTKAAKTFTAETRKEIYESYLDNLLNNSEKLCSL